jgi:hypothetical protein
LAIRDLAWKRQSRWIPKCLGFQDGGGYAELARIDARANDRRGPRVRICNFEEKFERPAYARFDEVAYMKL